MDLSSTPEASRPSWWQALRKWVLDPTVVGQVLLGLVLGLLLLSNLRMIDAMHRVEQQLNAFGAGPQEQSPLLDSDAVLDVRTDLGASRGPENAPITIVMFSDFECPFCAASRPTIERLFEKYPGMIRLVYRHFPLPGHVQALPAAEAAECARDQGRFWEMHDALFDNQHDLNETSYLAFAAAIGLDLEQFEACLTDHQHEGRILEDVAQGESYGISGTPVFFVNGRPIPGAADLIRFERVINEILQSTDTE